MNHTELCSVAKQYSESRLITVTNIIQIILATFCLFSVAINIECKCLGWKSVALHKNLKIIIYNATFLYIIHSISILLQQLNHQIKFHTYLDPCDLLIEYWKCLIFKFGQYLAMLGFTLLHIMLSFERTMAILRPAQYERTSALLGFVSLAIMYFIILSWSLYVFIGENFNQIFPYCNLTTATNGYKWTIEYGALMIVDITVLTIDILITIFNKKSLQSNTYQLNENAKAMSVILPITIAHSSVFIIFLLSTVIIRIFFQDLDPVTFRGLIECTNTLVCLYTVVIPLVYFRLRRNLNPKTTQVVPKGITETEIYFKMFNAVINSNK